jgi:chloramphenicol O-acetyltransferase type B
LDIKRQIVVLLITFNPFSKRRVRYSLGGYTVYTKDILKGSGFEIGEYTYGLPTVFLGAGAKLIIGRFCSIATGAMIDLGWSHRTDLATTYPMWAFPDDWTKARDFKPPDVIFVPKGDVVIGNDVWIGREALIMSGITIGDGAVIGARSVVTNDVEPYSIVAGNPARFIRKRFDQKTIERLIEVRWWDWPVEKINKNVHLICSDNLEALLSLTDS